ncbi:PIR protein, putative [Plasmodium sp.]|nr:PIR protein, putative [Plasmodium sp.]
MKVHYINILLFALPLNILINNQRNHNKRTYHTSNTKTIKSHRSLCECELYAQSNYENDQEMKDMIKEFNDRTAQRFEEYNERMQDKRKQCKEQCEKDIQKIILKDKIEKELTEKFSTLEANININDIPTCVCEKSITDKTEKFCVKCGKTMGAVAPSWCLVSGLGYAAWINYTTTTLVNIATDAGIQKGIQVGLSQITQIATQISHLQASQIPEIKVLTKMITGTFTEDVTLSGIFKTLDSAMVGKFDDGPCGVFSLWVQNVANNPYTLKQFSEQATAVETAFNNAKTVILTKAGHVTSSLSTAIIASVVAIMMYAFDKNKNIIYGMEDNNILM